MSLGEKDDLVCAAGQEGFPSAALVERTHGGAGEEGGVHGLPVDGEVKTSILDGRAGAALKTGLGGIENVFVGNVVPGAAAVVGKTQPNARLVHALSGDDRID